MKKNLKLIFYKGDNTVAFNLSFVLWPAKVDFVLEEQDCEKNVFTAYDIGCVKIIFLLSIKVVTLHMQAFIVQIEVRNLKSSILKSKICFIIFLALNK